MTVVLFMKRFCLSVMSLLAPPLSTGKFEAGINLALLLFLCQYCNWLSLHVNYIVCVNKVFKRLCDISINLSNLTTATFIFLSCKNRCVSEKNP